MSSENAKTLLVVKNEGVFKVTCSHVHFKSGSVLKTVLDKDVETTINCYDVGCISRSFIDYKLFSILTSVSRNPSAIAELLVHK